MTANLIEIVISGKNLSGPAIDSAAKQAEGLGGVMGKMGKLGVEALGAVAAESVHMATEYESVTTRLVTSAGEQNKNLKMVQQGMLDMAGQVGVSAIDLAKAMYFVESAGFHGADGLNVLKAAAQGAAAEGADTTTVVKAMTDVLVDYHLPASAAADVTSKMITAVAQGKTSLQEFSGAFASIVPAASAAGISFNDVAAALAEMTNHGFTANRASQNLAQALRSMLNPTGTMKTAFTEFGVSSATLKEKLSGPNGLTDAMEYLSQAATKMALKVGKEGTHEFMTAYAADLKLLMGTAPGANAAIATTGESFAATSQAIDKIGKSTKDAQGNVQGFAEMQATLGQKVKELRASFDSLMIELGDKLLPVLKQGADFMLKHKDAAVILVGALVVLTAGAMAASVAMKLAGGAQLLWTAGTKIATGVMWLFNDAAIGTRIELAALAITEKASAVATWLMNDACIGTRLGLIALAIAQKASAAAQWLFNAALDANPIGIVIIALAALGGAMYLLVTHWKEVTDFVKKYSTEIEIALLAVLGPFGPLLAAALFLSQHWRQVFGDLRQWLWDDFGKPIADFFTHTIPGWFDASVSGIEHAWNAVYNAIIAPVVRAYNDVAGFVARMIGDIESIPQHVQNAINSIPVVGGIAKAFGFAAGGVVGAADGGPRSGLTRINEQGGELVHLPTGATVMPHANSMAMLNAAGGGGGGAVQLEVLPGGASAFEQFMVMALRQWVRARAGNAPNSVQKAFGQAF